MVQTEQNPVSKLIRYRMVILRAACVFMLLFVLTVNRGCERNQITASTLLIQNSFEFKLPVANDLQQINLVSEVDDYSPAFLSHAWGVAFDKNGDVCLCSKGKGLATSELQNEQEVLAPSVLNNLHGVKNSKQIVHVIDSNYYKNGIATTANAMNTFKFSATNVTDFVLALSNHYVWDACSVVADKKSGRKVLVETAFNKNHKDYFDVINQAQRSVQIMSDTFPAVPFPFPHITVFDGTDQMEYPMMVNDNPTETREDAVQLTTHEIMHSYFPFYMGINETQYAWMDEGWATIGESVISPMLGEPEDEGIYSRGRVEHIAGTDQDVPMITNSKLQADFDYYANSYGKPGVCYWMLRDLLGDEKFFKALHAYMDTWNGKHPTPYDFFYIFNNASGENLDWFWKPWFFDWGYPDLAIQNVKMENSKWNIVVEKKGNIPVPITLDITMKDGSVIHHHETAEVWRDGKMTFVYQVKGEIKSITLGDIYTPDVNRKDNEWKQ